MLVAVEGVDGSGKGTQTRLLAERARAEGLEVGVFSFPRYDDNAFGRLCGRFLDGDFGQSSPELAALPYAGDRWLAKPAIEEVLAAGGLVLCDRYVASNMAHQGARASAADRPRVVELIAELEYGHYALPRPRLTILLDVPAETAHELVGRKEARTYTSDAHDMLEGDTGHLGAAQEVYRSLADESWLVVEPVRDGGLRAPEDIAAEIWDAVRSRL